MKSTLKSTLKYMLVLLLVSVTAEVSYGQHKVSGTITDATDGQALPGVNILIKGTSRGVASDQMGQYELEVSSPNDTLIVSYIGYERQVIPVNGRNVIDIAMQSQALQSEDIIVTGYGVQQKVDVTGSVAVADAEDLKRSSSSPTLAGALQGQVSGVQISSSGAPGESPEVKIRGVSTFGNNNPLYIVDGVPFGDIIDLNTNDIESVQVLKDAAAAAIYGSRAANGVVIITTKSGQKGDLKIDYNGSVGTANIYQRYDMMGRKDYQNLMNEMLANAGEPPAPGNDPNSQFYIDNINTDWQDATYEPGMLTSHDLTISGGNETSTYSLSGSYLSQEGHVKGPAPYYDRYTARIKSQHELGKLSVGETVIFAKSNQKRQESRHEISFINNLIKAIPTMPIYDSNRLGGYGGADANIERAITLNPIGVNNLLDSEVDATRFFANAWAQYDILDNLSYKLNVSYNNRKHEDFFWVPTYDLGFFFTNNIATLDDTRGELINTVIENTLNYKVTLGKHDLDLLAGYTEERGKYSQVWGHAEGFSRPYFKVLDAGTSGKATGGYITKNSLRSFLGRVRYNYDDRYLVSASVRRDGSSRFGENNRYGVFPSVSVGWRISNESFFDVPFINEFKMRASYGEVGNQDIANFATAAFINTNANYNFNGHLAPGAIQLSLANPNIQWETSIQRDIGLDVNMFNDRFLVSVDYYNNKTEDILLNVPIPNSVGSLEYPTVNAASMKNSGFEISMTYRNSFKGVDFSLSPNITTQHNEVLSLGENGEPIYGAASKTAVGHPVGAIYGYVSDGLFQSMDEINTVAPGDPNYDPNKHAYQTPGTAPGDIKFKDLNGDGLITDEDRTYIGNPVPDFIYGFNASASYKNWDVSMFFQGTYGNDIFNSQRRTFENMAGYDNHTTRMLDRWTPDNRDTNIPRAIYLDPNQNNRDSDRWVEDGSYLRLQNLTIGYSLPQRLLKQFGIAQLRVYATGQNLFTITGYSGLDPDLGDDGDEVDNDGLFSRGFDSGAWPHPRIFKGGIQLSL